MKLYQREAKSHTYEKGWNLKQCFFNILYTTKFKKIIIIKVEDQYKVVNFYICQVRTFKKQTAKATQTTASHYNHHFINKRYLNSKFRKNIM